MSLTTNLGLESSAGSSYAFGVYSDQLKNITGFSQDEIQTVASIGNVGLYFAVIAGVVFDKKGPFITILVGFILSVGGYLAMWGSTQGYLPADVASLSAYAFIWSNGSSWYDTVAISANIRNFPNDRGRIVGLLKSLFGLSASLITVVYASFYKSADPRASCDVLLFLAVYSGVVGLVGLFTSKLVPPSQAVKITGFEDTLLTVAMALLGCLAIYVTVISILNNDGDTEGEGWPSFVMLPIIALQCILLIPLCRKKDTKKVFKGTDSEQAALLGTDADGKPNTGVDETKDEVVTSSGSSLITIVKSVEFWLLTFMMLFGTGAGLTVINNIAQQIKALRGRNAASDADANLFIVLLSIGNCGGRLFWGYCSDRFQRVNRAGWLTIVTASTSGAMLFCGNSDLNMMYFATIWSGISYGGYWAIVPGILADLFGTKWFAATYSLVSLFPALGSYLLSAQLSSQLYEDKVLPMENECYGKQCFLLAYEIIGVLCAVSIIPGLVLTYKTRTILTSATAKLASS